MLPTTVRAHFVSNLPNPISRANSKFLLSTFQRHQPVLPLRGGTRTNLAGFHTACIAFRSPQPLPPPSPSEYERKSAPVPSRHLIWYRDFVPAIIPLILLGSCIYIGLQLAQSYLAHEKYLDGAHARIAELEGQLDELRRSVETPSHSEKNASIANEQSKRGRWWSLGLF